VVETIEPAKKKQPWEALSSWEPSRVDSEYAAGNIPLEHAQNYYINRNLKQGLYEVPEEQLDLALERGFINEHEHWKAKWKAESPVSFFATDVAQSVAHGAAKAGKEGWGTVIDLANSIPFLDFRPIKEDGTRMSGSEIVEELAGTDKYVDNTLKPQTSAGELTSGISQYATGAALMAPYGGHSLKLMNAALPKGATFVTNMVNNRIVRAAAEGAVVDMAFFNARDTGITDALHEIPAVRPYVIDYLRSDPTDSVAEAKLKHALEGVLVGVPFDYMLKGVKALKEMTWRSKNGDKNAVDEVVNAIEKDTATPENVAIEREARFNDDQFKLPLKDIEPLDPKNADPEAVKVLNISTEQRRVDAANSIQFLSKSKNVKAVLDDAEFDGMVDSMVNHTPADIIDIVKTQGLVSDERLVQAKGTLKDTQLDYRANKLVRELFGDEESTARLARLAGNVEELPETLNAAGKALLAYNRAIMKLVEETESKTISQELKDIKTLQAQELMFKSTELYDYVNYGATQVGRALRQFQLMKKDGGYSKEILEQLKDSKDLETMRQNLKALAYAKKKGLTDADQTKLMRRANGQGWTGKLLQLVQANLLWRPVTHIRNIVGNTSALAVDSAAYAGGTLWAGISNRELGNALKEVKAYGKGLREGFLYAVKEAPDGGKPTALQAFSEGQVMRKGDLSKWEMEGSSFWGSDNPVGKTVFMPFKLLAAMDEVFKSPAYEARKLAAIEREAQRMAKAGSTEDAIKEYKVTQLVNTADDIHAEAVKHMQEVTFTNEMPDAVRNASQGLFKTMLAIANATPMEAATALSVTRGTANLFKVACMPFVSVPINVTRWTMKHTPAAIVLKSFWNDILSGNAARRNEALFKVGLGSYAAYIGYGLHEDGAATGYISDKEKDAMGAAGYTPWSYIGDGKSYNLMSLSPVGFIMSTGIMCSQIWDYMDLPTETDEELNDVFDRAVGTFLSVPLEAPFLSSLKETMALISGDRNYTRFMTQQIPKLIPFSSLLDDANKALFDEYVKDTADATDMVMQRLGFFGNVANWLQGKDLENAPLPKCHPVLGSPIELNSWYTAIGEGDWVAIMGSRQREVVNSPLVQTMARLNVGLEPIRDSMTWNGGEVEMTAQERYEYYQLVHETGIDETLSTYVQDEGFKELERSAPDEAARMLKKLVRQYHTMAKQQFFERRGYEPQYKAQHERLLRATGQMEPKTKNSKLYKYLTQ
jgi:hypothetical protein